MFKSLISGLLFTASAVVSAQTTAESTQCPTEGDWLQILGSGGPEISDGRASASYLIWQNGKARVLIDMGSGALLNFEKSGARFEDLSAVAFTHFHIDHSADFAPLIKGGFFTRRSEDLPLFGPATNDFLPGADAFVQRLFRTGSSESENQRTENQNAGVWPYLSGYLPAKKNRRSESYQILPQAIPATGNRIQPAWQNNNISLSAISVNHGPLPALAWRIDLASEKNTAKDIFSVVISGDMSDQSGHLQTLLKNSDLFVAHHAIPESATGIARRLHMPPSRIADNAARAEVLHLVLAHIMTRAAADLEHSQQLIRKQYQGDVSVAEDLDCFALNQG